MKDKETLDIMETLCIKADKCENPLNKNGNFGNWHSGICFKGFHHSDDFKQKTSEQFKKLWEDEDFRKHMISVRMGRKNTEETKQLMSESAKKSWTDERRAAAIESGNYSHNHTEETKKFLSENIKGRIRINNGVIEKMVRNPEKYLNEGWVLGKLPISDETRLRMSESAKKRKCNTAGKKKIHKGNIGKFVSIEELQKYLDEGWEIGVTPEKKKHLQEIAKRH